MRQAVDSLFVATEGQGLYAITDQARSWVEQHGMDTGLLTLFCRHSSASLLIQENADPDVRTDLQRFFAAIAPESATRYTHNDEGPDDMPAHLRTALTQTHLAVPLIGGRLALGTWQGLYLFEHRAAPHRRTIALHLVGA